MPEGTADNQHSSKVIRILDIKEVSDALKGIESSNAEGLLSEASLYSIVILNFRLEWIESLEAAKRLAHTGAGDGIINLLEPESVGGLVGYYKYLETAAHQVVSLVNQYRGEFNSSEPLEISQQDKVRFDSLIDGVKARYNQAVVEIDAVRYHHLVQQIKELAGGNLVGNLEKLQAGIAKATLLKEELDLLLRTKEATMASLADTDVKAREIKVSSQEAATELEAIKSIKKEGDDLVKSIRASSTSLSLSQYIDNFEADYNRSRYYSWAWLTATFSLIWYGIYYATIFLDISKDPQYANISFDLKNLQTASLVGSRFVFISLITYAIVFCARNYRTLRHNSVVARHKHNSLKAYESFERISNHDKEIRAVVLPEAIKTVFASVVSGYQVSESEGESSNKWLEVVKSMASDGAKKAQGDQ